MLNDNSLEVSMFSVFRLEFYDAFIKLVAAANQNKMVRISPFNKNEQIAEKLNLKVKSSINILIAHMALIGVKSVGLLGRYRNM
ncbi:MAG: hypothetical protein WAM14_07785 [Candidatus Nitrosopolaris sp.]